MNIQQGLVFVKTPKGEDEVRTRGMQLDRNARLVLILIDGQITASELIQKLPGTENVPSFIAMLWREGLIEPAGSFGALDDTPVEAPQPAHLIDRLDTAASYPTPAIISTTERIEPGLSAGGSLSDKSQERASITQPQIMGRESGAARMPSPGVIQRPSSMANTPKPKRSLPSFRIDGRKLRMALLLGCCAVAVTLTMVVVALPFVRLPVHIGSGNQAVAGLCGAEATYDGIKFQLLPSPVLNMQSIQGGRCPSIASLAVGMRVSDWFSDAPFVSSLGVSGVELSAAQFEQTLLQARLSDVASEADLPVAFADVQLKTAYGSLENLAGEGRFSQGRLTKLALTTVDKTTSIDMVRNPSNAWQLQLAWPTLKVASVQLSNLQANGEWSAQGLRFDSLNASTSGGKISGRASLQNQPNQLTADLSLKGVAANGFVFTTLRVISEGDVSGQLHLQVAGPQDKPLKDRLQLSGDLKIANGSLSGADLLDVAQTDQASYQASGRTLFLDSRVHANMNNGRWQLSGLQLTGAAVDAHGDLTSDDDRVVGNLVISSAKLNLPASAWQINGTQGTWKFQRKGGVLKTANAPKNVPAEDSGGNSDTTDSQASP